MNAKSLIGMTVFAVEGGKNLGTVDRLLFSPDGMRVTAFVVAPVAGMMDEPGPQKLVSTDKVKAIGQDAITLEAEELLDVMADGELPAGSVAFDQIEHEKVITESGNDVGEISSIEFDEQTFSLDFIEVGRGFLSGNSMITVENIVSVGEDVIVVKDTALDAVDDSGGGGGLFGGGDDDADLVDEDKRDADDDDLIIDRR